LKRTVWNSKCSSWYKNEKGRISALYPGSIIHFVRPTTAAAADRTMLTRQQKHMIAEIRGEDFDITYRNPKVIPIDLAVLKSCLTVPESLGVSWRWIHPAGDGRWRSCLLFTSRFCRMIIRHDVRIGWQDNGNTRTWLPLSECIWCLWEPVSCTSPSEQRIMALISDPPLFFGLQI
jgi:hypothetical protein